MNLDITESMIGVSPAQKRVNAIGEPSSKTGFITTLAFFFDFITTACLSKLQAKCRVALAARAHICHHVAKHTHTHIHAELFFLFGIKTKSFFIFFPSKIHPMAHAHMLVSLSPFDRRKQERPPTK